MENIALIFGGNSFEKDISIITALLAFNNINKKMYKVHMIMMDKTFKYLLNGEKLENYKGDLKYREGFFLDGYFYIKKKRKIKNKIKIDCALICAHGGEGEDGTIQNYLKINNIPYTSSDALSMQIGMNKWLTKNYLNNLKIKQLRYKKIKKGEKIIFEKDVIVKPNSLGSSIGVFVAKNQIQLNEALNECFKLDDIVIIEEYLEDYKEYNIAIIKSDDKIITSSIEEVNTKNLFLTFSDKYLNEIESRIINPKMEDNIEKQMRQTSEKIYKDLSMRGVVRFDFLVKDKKVYLNEFNMVPGSLAYYLFKGYDFKDLIYMMIKEGIKDANIKKEKKYISSVLDNFTSSNKMMKTTKT